MSIRSEAVPLHAFPATLTYYVSTVEPERDSLELGGQVK